MIEKAFCDTCIVIARVFPVNSLHFKSNQVFDTYSELFWSKFVKEEYYKRYDEKHDHLLRFFQDIELELENPSKELYSSKDLIKFANSFSDKLKNDSVSSVDPFWNKYVGIESQIPFYNLKNNIDECLNDLSINVEINRMKLESVMQLTPQRTKKYSKIDKILKTKGVKDADRTVTLDGHDFACKSSNPIDFVTFDDDCYNGAKNIELLCFDSIKGKYDFTAS